MRRAFPCGNLACWPVLLLLLLFPAREIVAHKIYVGPGLEVDNIQYALTLANDGDTIIVKDGVYTQYVKVAKSVVLMAEHMHGAVIGDGSGQQHQIAIRFEKVDGVVIDGFKFAPANYPGIFVSDLDADHAASNCIIRNNLIEGRPKGIIVSPTAQNTTLTGNIIRSCPGPGIDFSGVGTSEISDNRVVNGALGIVINLNEEKLQGEPGSVLLRGNEIRNDTAGGIAINHRPNVTFERNIIDDNKFGIQTNTGIDGIVIRDSNQVINNAEAGIDIENEVEATIRDNLIRGNGYNGIHTRGNSVITGNVIEENGEMGIWVRSGDAVVEDNDLSYNMIHGLEIAGEAGNSTIRNNLIQGNHSCGIMNNGTSVITGNVVEENGEMGIWIMSGDAYVEDNKVSCNMIHGLEIAGEAGYSRIYNNRITGNREQGIFVGRQALIQGNLIDSNAGHGIMLAEGCQDLEIISDTISNNLGHEVYVTANSSALIKSCLLEDDTTNMDQRHGHSGINIEGSAIVARNTIRKMNRSGVFVSEVAGEEVDIMNNTIMECRNAVTVRGSVRIQDNNFKDNQERGILIGTQAENVDLFRNEITANPVGVVARSGSPGITIRRNLISGNGEGVWTEGEVSLRSNDILDNDSCGIRIMLGGIDLGTGETADSGLNNIMNNGMWNVINEAPEEVHAQYNWWGMSDADSIDATIWDDDEDSQKGKVLFEPFLGLIYVGTEDGVHLMDPGKNQRFYHVAPGSMEVYPNPFTRETNISFTMDEPRNACLSVLNLSGRTVRSIHAGLLPAGQQRLTWDGVTNSGVKVVSGIYFIILETGEYSVTRKVIFQE